MEPSHWNTDGLTGLASLDSTSLDFTAPVVEIGLFDFNTENLRNQDDELQTLSMAFGRPQIDIGGFGTPQASLAAGGASTDLTTANHGTIQTAPLSMLPPRTSRSKPFFLPSC